MAFSRKHQSHKGSTPKPEPLSESGSRIGKRSSYGVPVVAMPSHAEAPVHIDVGGVIYTSTLETLTKFPESKLAKMFSGRIPIVVDKLKQHYFIDRDGGMFRHILNYLRNDSVLVPFDFKYMDLLVAEAQFFELADMVLQISMMREAREGA